MEMACHNEAAILCHFQLPINLIRLRAEYFLDNFTFYFQVLYSFLYLVLADDDYNN